MNVPVFSWFSYERNRTTYSPTIFNKLLSALVCVDYILVYFTEIDSHLYHFTIFINTVFLNITVGVEENLSNFCNICKFWYIINIDRQNTCFVWGCLLYWSSLGRSNQSNGLASKALITRISKQDCAARCHLLCGVISLSSVRRIPVSVAYSRGNFSAAILSLWTFESQLVQNNCICTLYRPKRRRAQCTPKSHTAERNAFRFRTICFYSAFANRLFAARPSWASLKFHSLERKGKRISFICAVNTHRATLLCTTRKVNQLKEICNFKFKQW